MAKIGAITGITAGVVIIAACILVLYVIYRIKRFLEPLQEIAKYVNSEEQEREIEMTPKSVNAMTSVYLPRIQQDFPEFNYFEFKAKAENMMKSAFNAISTEDISCLKNASNDLTSQIRNTIETNSANHIKETYRDIDIHRTEIKNYRKNAGTCVITLQSSVGYIHYISKSNGEIVNGSDTHTFQTRYDIDLMYVQDVMKIEPGKVAVSNNCPNCGAPMTSLGEKHCPYCGSALEGINIHTWSINKITEC